MINTPTPAQTLVDNLVFFYSQGKTNDCENLARSILANFPHHGFTWKVLGALLFQQERLDEAVSAMRKSVHFLPNDHDALNNLGLSLKNKGLLTESESTLRLALTIKKDFAEAHNNLGVTLMAQGRLADSEECFRQALHLMPEYTEAYCNLGINLKDQGRFAESEENFQHALKLRPSYAEAFNNLGNVLHGTGRLSEAEDFLRKALELKPDFAIAYNNLGNVLHCQGHLEESEHCYHKALYLKPDYSEAYDGLLFVSNYHPDKTDQEIFQLYQGYDERFGRPHCIHPVAHANSRDCNRRLKVAYVSPAFYSHPVAHFLEPLLTHHDNTRFEVYAYAEISREDHITGSYKQHVHHWVPTVGLSDDQLAERIRSDEIDILVDLAGHTGRNRLGVFARKPAPVSLHWLDFGYTTGLSAIDYYLTDLSSAPIGSENLFSEQVWRLPRPAFAYRPATGMGHISPLPAAQRGYTTFGTLTRAIRINHRTIRVWSEILRRVEGSRLVIDSGNFKDPAIQQTLKEKFAAQGIESSRLSIGYHSPPWDVLRDIDIGLDCFPHNSGTTLFESLYMGIPFITLANRPGVGRLGCSVLEGAGHPEWIANSENEYIEKALSLASNLPALASIRASLRQEMQDCPLMDEEGFTRNIEKAYQSMFKQWCHNSIPVPEGTDNPSLIDRKPSRAIDDSIALYNLGVDLQRQERIAEAKISYIQAINISHNFIEAYNNLGVIKQQEGKFSEAEASFLQAIEIKPDYADAYYNLANTYKLQQKLFDAEEKYRKVIELVSDNANAHYNLGYILQEQGRLHEAEICLRNALKLSPDHIKAFSTLLFALNYHPDKNSEEIFKAYQEFNVRFCQPYHETWLSHTNSLGENRRLKIGYVASDYRKHPARYFLEPLLAHHDKRSVETYAYVELSSEDAATDLFHGYVEHWVPTAGLTDDQISEHIRNDAIDILVDLAGHTAGNRLGVFARKPAPISLHWLDFGYTTGLTAIDYYLTDHAAVPTGSERFFSETPWRLETPALAYRPPGVTGPVNELPAQSHGYVTFGTLTRAIRINHRTIRVWSEILKKCEGSRLIINSGSFREPAMQLALADRFMKQGVERDRLDIGCESPPWDLLRNTDICLDCFPHNSGTTLVESLYMGVPFITLADRPSVGRLGSSILKGIGHPEWIAETENEYIRKAVSLASDFTKLASVRLYLREEMAKSPLMDEVGFARKVEGAYREMFNKWRTSQQMEASPRVIRQSKKNSKKKRASDSYGKGPHAQEINRLTQLFNNGKYAEATELAISLTTRFPHHGFGWKVLGPLLHQQGLAEDAIQAMKQAALYMPDDPETHFNLAIALQQARLLGEAEYSYRRTLHLNQDHFQAHYNLGNILRDNGKPAEAENCYNRALALKPDYFEVLCNLGNILKAQGRLSESAAGYRSALTIRPDSEEIYNNLSLVLKEQGLLAGVDQTLLAEAEFACKQALKLKQNFPEALNNLGIIYQAQGNFSEAETCYRQAIEFQPRYSIAYYNLGLILQKQGRLDEAELICYQALKVDPNNAQLYKNLGSIQSYQGRLEEAESNLNRSLEINPDYTVAHSTLLFLLNYHPDKSGEEIFEEYKNFNARFACPLQREWQPHTNNYRINRRLKVGYVSRHFSAHSMRHFLEPLLAHHDQNVVEIYAYADMYQQEGEIADRYKSYVDNWINIKGLNDPDLAKRIRADGIDILVDLAGHTGGNRLGVFARKPAPVSLHWLDFGYTTGLTAIDYYLTDSAAVPLGSEGLFAETPWRIETPCLVYRPAEGMGEVSSLPATARGYVTFGTLTRAVRINHRTIRVWSEILKRVEGSHLVIDSRNFQDATMQEEMADKFIAHGIDRERLEIGCHSPPWDVLRGLDVGLDCFPHNSGTTLFETLYMGVPFITLADRPSVGRLGCSILEGLGHPEWIAHTEEEYVELAVALAADLHNLGILRAGLRAEIEKSPLMDEPNFARKVESAYKEMFAKWCESQKFLQTQNDSEIQSALSAPVDQNLQETEVLNQSNPVTDSQPEESYRLGCMAMERHQPSAALPYFETALDIRPDHGPYWLAYIDALDKAGQPEHARQILEMAIEAGLDGEVAQELKVRLTSSSQNPRAESLESQHTTETQRDASTLQHNAVQSSPSPTTDETKRLISLFHQGKYAECEELARSITKIYPENGFAWKALGTTLKLRGLLDEAVFALQQALALSQKDTETHHNLGDIFFTQGRFIEAENIYQCSLLHNPGIAESHYALANTLVELGNLEEAEGNYRKALELKPDYAEALSNLGNTLQRQGKLLESEMSYLHALAIKPDFAEAYFNFGNLLREQNRFSESQELYQKALELRGNYYKACSNLGICLQMQGQLREAENNYQKAIGINPQFVEAHINLGACLKEQGRYREAEKCYRDALAISPDYALCYSNLGAVIKEHGQLTEAEKCLRRALELKPDYTEAHSNLLFLLNYHPDMSAESIFEEYRNFNTRFCLPLQKEWTSHTNSRQSNRRLKIGYVSPQFRLHSIRHFLEPLLAHHDKQQVEIFAYSDVGKEDTVTRRYRSYVDHWVITVGLNDATLAERIRTDGIDILVDLAGHTAHNRLRMFALKPAPVSLHWLDYGYTTGLTAIDYYLTDQATIPEGNDGLLSETPWRLETPCLAYRPAEGMGEVTSLPAIGRGHITFGTLTRAVRINHRTIRVWSEILKRVENSRLVIDSSNFKDVAMQEELAERFLSHGISRERLEIGFHSPPWDVLRNLDISLDCFPHNSGTTLFETLYMGVPFITLADRPSVGRLGCSILEGLGHAEWTAYTEEEYVELAVTLASDLPKLADIRNGLRHKMKKSPLMDEPAFSRKVEAAYREMFMKWCENEQSGSSMQENSKVTTTFLQTVLHQAEILYNAGQLQEARAVFLSILETDPQHSEANYSLGCIEVALQQPSAALPFFVAAVDARPEHGPYWLAYIDALDKDGQSESAHQLLDMAIQAGLDGEEVTALQDRLTSKPIEPSVEKTRNSRTVKSLKKRKSKQNKKTASPHPDETNRLVSLFQQGNLIEAETIARSLIARYPRNSFAWKVIGAIRRQQGALEEALSAMKTAVTFTPEDYICLRNIAVMLCDLKRYVEAEKYCRRSLRIKPDYADAHNTLSIAFRSQKKLPEAESSCRKAMKLKPASAEIFVNLGLVLNETKKYSEAEKYYHKALDLNPAFAEAYCGLGITLQATNRMLEAEAACRQALALKPDYAAAYNSLGGILNEQERYEEAETFYLRALALNPSYTEALHNLGKTHFNKGQLSEAESCYRQVLETETNNAETYYNLGNVLADQGRHKEAETNFRTALKIRPDYPEAYINLGNTFRKQGWIIEAEKTYRNVLQMHPEYEKAFNNLGNILQEQGRLSEAEDIFRTVLDLKPDFAGAYGNLLFLLNYHPDKSGEEIFLEYVNFEEKFGQPLRTEWKWHANNRIINRRLKIGYVSPQFCQHPVCNFLEPLLACHNKDLVELYAYAEISKEDSATERYKSYMEHWIPTKGMTDADMAARIRADRIDILVDLAGHTSLNRLLVFARKPAPVSLHWLDFGYTTGLTAIDYYLSDNASVPTGTEGLFSETPWKLKTPGLVYRPSEGMGEVNTLPAIERGYITFGSLSRAVRINYRTIRAWAEILKRVEGSHLVINSGNFKDPVMQDMLAEKFIAHGIESERLEIGSTSPPWDVLRGLDIGLDCFPHNSGTTLFETLYMGIPFVTLAGRASVGRLGCSVLEGLGHPELIAESEEDYVERVVALAFDLPRLATLRAGLRQEMKMSPLMNEPAFACKVEVAYREMFAKWSEEQQ